MVRQHHRFNGHEFEQTPGDWRTEEPGILQSTGLQRVGRDLLTEQQQKRKISFKKKKTFFAFNRSYML